MSKYPRSIIRVFHHLRISSEDFVVPRTRESSSSHLCRFADGGVLFTRHACGALSSRAMCRRRNFWDRFCKGGHVQQPDRAGPLVIFVLVRVSHIRTAITSPLRCYNVLYLNSVYAKSLLFSTFSIRIFCEGFSERGQLLIKI